MIEGIPARTMTVAPPAPANDKDSKLRKVAGQLEGLFVQQLFKTMRETVPQGEGIVSGGAGEEIFTGLLDQHLAAETPKQMESGLSEAPYRQLRGLAGEAAPPPTTAATPMHTGSSTL
jgi:peptidoglycan hydrolase FlgJ